YKGLYPACFPVLFRVIYLNFIKKSEDVKEIFPFRYGALRGQFVCPNQLFLYAGKAASRAKYYHYLYARRRSCRHKSFPRGSSFYPPGRRWPGGQGSPVKKDWRCLYSYPSNRYG